MIKESIAEIKTKAKNDKGLSEKIPNGTFMPINEAIIVGMEKTIVIPDKNFIITFKLFEIILA